MKLILRWVFNAAAIIVGAYLISGISVAGIWTALILAVFLGLVNAVLKPILVVITLPINILTLGLFTFVINALLILLAGTVVKGFDVDGFVPALLFGLVISVVSYILNTLFGTKK